jgi:large conductance mechanosensitive channel
MLTEFRQFVLRGNVVDLAVAVVVGVAFTAVVNAFVADIVTPIIAAIGGKPDFAGLTFTVNGSHFLYGAFLNAVLAFGMVAAAVFFLLVKPVNALEARRARSDPEAATTRACPECRSQIPVDARRCAFCTSEVGTA